MMYRTLLIGALSLFSATAAFAQTPTSLGTFNDWTAWTYAGKKGKVCYVHAVPKTKAPDGLNHGDVSFFIRRSPADKIQSESNFVVGYPFKENSTVTADIDGKKFTMFTQGDSAWLLNAGEEPQLVAGMKAGKKLIMSGQSGRGNPTTYTFSLSGLTAALSKINGECK
ncbi:hypothetical protein SAMN05216548_105212 [Faunimonas pinastri]|uniref:Uncharacterized protein n=1 Tax=Faunimonas pinastri TaxID=1855383 RepID=A0A1H9H122_9HYPH|nr:invasion associated locus B family protein [Faunimonas pinastri]SEQ56031.1 hypothetical protein SAMN05216548_105212 [Faunimonas pinastri]